MQFGRTVSASLLTIAVLLAAASPTDAADSLFRIRHGHSVILFSAKALDQAGLTVTMLGGDPVATDRPLELEVDPGSPFMAVANVMVGDFTHLQAFHQGGLTFRTATGQFNTSSLLIDASSGVRQADFADASPRLILIGGDRMFDVPGNTLSIAEATLALSPMLAEQLGQPDLAGAVVGRVHVHLEVDRPDGVFPADIDDDMRVCTNPSQGPDVVVGALEQGGGGGTVANYSALGGIDAFAFATYSCNIGNVNLSWVANSNLHPVIGGSVYRYKVVDGAGRMEQIGIGWLKHGFTALTHSICANCTCNGQGGSVLGQGCADPYTAGRNGTQLTTSGGLGPRFQVNAHTGVFTWPYMFRNQAIPGGETSISRRVQVKFDDLNTALNPGAQYFAEGQYVTQDDAAAGNAHNNASYIPLTLSQTGNPTPTNFAFTGVTSSPVGATTVRKAAIQAWKAIDPSVTETILDVPEDSGQPTARLILAAKATAIAGGMYRYEYALYNMNSDRSVQAFSVPVDPGVTVTNIGFHDVFYHDPDGCGSTQANPITFDGTDWPGVFNSGAVTWSMVPLTGTGANAPCNANALRWGTTYNFRFDANVPPTSGESTILQWKTVRDVGAVTVIPSVPACAMPGDVNGDNAVDGLDIPNFTKMYIGDMPVSPCAELAGPTGPLTQEDLDAFVALLLAGA